MKKAIAVAFAVAIISGTIVVDNEYANNAKPKEEPQPEVETQYVEVEKIVEVKTPVYLESEPIVIYTPLEVEYDSFPLTDAERLEAERIVMGEAGNQGVTGMMLVAQCLRNAAELDGLSVSGVRSKYQYSGYCTAVSDEAVEAVSRVFDRGEKVVEDVKSRATKTKDYILRRKLMNWRHGIQIKEV